MNPRQRLIVNINIDWRVVFLICITVTLMGLTYYNVAGKQEVKSVVQEAPAKAAIFTGYYNLMGFEGIPVAGEYGTPPPVGDYTSTYCRYINVQNTQLGDYFLHYPLHFPNGVTVTAVSLHIADYNNPGTLYAFLYQRQWNSRDSGTYISNASSNIGADGDITINMYPSNLGFSVDNENYDYWINATTSNNTYPGQLCIYGIHITYTYDGSLLPMIVRNN